MAESHITVHVNARFADWWVLFCQAMVEPLFGFDVAFRVARWGVTRLLWVKVGDGRWRRMRPDE